MLSAMGECFSPEAATSLACARHSGVALESPRAPRTTRPLAIAADAWLSHRRRAWSATARALLSSSKRVSSTFRSRRVTLGLIARFTKCERCSRTSSDSWLRHAVPDGRGFLGGFWFLPGPWLKPGFEEKGFSGLQHNMTIVQDLIDGFNEMVQSAAAEFAHVHFADLRPI